MKQFLMLLTVVCVFKNPFAYPYKTNAELTDEAPTPEAACAQVLDCLNNVLCVRYGEPGLKGGWVLDSIEETN